MKIEVVPTVRLDQPRCAGCGQSAHLTLRPNQAQTEAGLKPLDLCHDCARRFLRMLNDSTRTND